MHKARYFCTEKGRKRRNLEFAFTGILQQHSGYQQRCPILPVPFIGYLLHSSERQKLAFKFGEYHIWLLTAV